MKETEKNQPLERKYFEVEINGATKRIPALDKTWLDLKERNFSKYISHPVPVNGKFILGEREIWLELTGYVIADLEWLLQQKHHIFWSYMIFSKEAQQLLVTFLQEAPPFYMRDSFPKDKDMEEALEKIEHLVFLTFTRLSTEIESESRYVENLGQLLYNNYIFTVPIMLDICLVYGTRNSQLVGSMIEGVISVAPQYLNDFREIVPHLTHVLSVVKDKFDSNEIMFNTRTITHFNSVRDLLLHLYDSTTTVRIFVDIYPNGSKLLRKESFASEVASFYTAVIPKIHKFIRSNDCNMFRNWDFADKIDSIRLDLLSLVRGMFCGIVNDVLTGGEQRGEFANEYLTKMLEILHEPLFLSDYNRIYPIDGDLKMLIDMCQDMDSESLRYITKAIAPLFETPPARTSQPVTGVELDSLITQVKDIFPNFGDGFVEECVRYFDYDAERVIAVILEDNLPSELDKMDRNAARKERELTPPPPEARKIDKIKQKNPEMFDVMDDKTDVREMKEKFSYLALISDDDYSDEYDDTYDGHDVSIKGADDADQERRPFVTPRILEGRVSEEEEEEDDDDDEAEEEEAKRKVFDQFVPNPEEIRARQAQKWAERGRRDCIGRGRGRGQDKQVLANRDFKNTHKSFTSNHNRRKLASRKRNMPLIHS